jgi:hypothetical protein
MVKGASKVLLKKMEVLDININQAKRMIVHYRSEKNDPTHTAYGMWMDIHKQLVKDKVKLAKKIPGEKRWF